MVKNKELNQWKNKNKILTNYSFGDMGMPM